MYPTSSPALRCRRRALLAWMTAALALAPRAALAVEIREVRKVVEAGAVVFEVDFALPEDFDPNQWRHYPALPRTPWPRLPELLASPVHRYAAHPKYVRADRLTFVVRGDAAESLDLTLRWPTSDGGWKSELVRIGLTDARALTIPQGTARRYWLLGQADWFAAMARGSGDPTGLYTYAAVRTRRAEGVTEPEALRAGLPSADERRWRDGFELATGWSALQETMQLDRMTGADQDRGQRTIPLSEITPIDVISHPFDEMRGERAARHSRLARLTPEDFYYARFERLEKLLELLKLLRDWGGPLLSMAQVDGGGADLAARLMRQLCLNDEVLEQLVAERQVTEIAVIGSDPYLAQGSDLTLLFAARDPASFRAVADQALDAALQDVGGASSALTQVAGVEVEVMTAPDRVLSLYRGQLDDVWVYSNSRAALLRVIETHRGRRACLADAADFKYMRAAVFPLDPDTEDGFVYLSDPFLRRVVGPELRIGQRRRLQAVTSLKVLSNAALLYGFRLGPGEPEFEDFVKAGALDPNDLYDPAGGIFTWDTRGVPRSSTYGRLNWLTPLIEMPCERVTAAEKAEYDGFRERYSRYWREYFDPVGARLKLDQRVRVETCILPLIESSAYNDLRQFAGGEPIRVNLADISKTVVCRATWKLNERARREVTKALLDVVPQPRAEWIGQWMTLWVEEDDELLKLARRYYHGRPITSAFDVFWMLSASWVAGVHVTDAANLAEWLPRFREVSSIRTFLGEATELEPQHGVPITRLAHKGGPARDDDFGVCAATIGDGHYLATKETTLRALVDHLTQRPRGAAGGPADEIAHANLALYFSPAADGRLRPAVAYMLEQQARRGARHSMAQAWLLGRCGMIERMSLDDAGDCLLGYALSDAYGGPLVYDPRQVMVQSERYGAMNEPRVLDAPPEDAAITSVLRSLDAVLATLRFTDEGIMTTVELRRR
ncbi:MAG TPA: hypothetical protein PKC49_04735 [Phycisphaerae bacterium]|nr:hypothetical protein [Phycisphaerae bacterium]